MTAWQTDDEYTSAQAAISLPTPQDTPYRTPSTKSKKSRRSVTPPGKGTSPSRMANGEKGSKRSSRDVSTDEHISILDPRRFTPTLHANLVSEILTLRRDQEEKTKLIESLESALQSSREEHESLQANFTTTSKETRSLQRQLSLLEGGTSSALGELSRERDEAVDSVTDARKRLEAAQKKIRSQEEDSQRVHDLWAQEKDNWEDEKRKYERKLHVAESRLKIVLDEVATYQVDQVNGSAHNGHESEGEESGRDNDAASMRTMSMTNSIRFSMANGPGSALPNGNSLADELNFDDTDDQTDVDGRESVLSSPRHKRTFSRESVISKLHRRNLSMESLKRPGSVARGRLFMNQAVLEALEGEDEDVENSKPTSIPAPKPSYTDSGIQYSPPPSPKLEPVKPVTPEPIIEHKLDKLAELESSPRSSEIEANQRRKRVSLPLTIEPPSLFQRMVSSSSQTNDLPLSPPKTPKSPYIDSVPTTAEAEPPVSEIEPPKMVTSATQTDPPPILAPVPIAIPPPPPPPLEIPSISIQPPTSRPTTPHTPRLPQYSKDFGCQVNLSSQVEIADASCQTDSIQTDKRLALLPAHLQPSSISSRPVSPNPSGVAVPEKSFTPVPGNLPPRNPRRLQGSRTSNDLPSSPISMDGGDLPEDYPGNDDGPLSNQKNAPMRRPRRYSSLYSGFCTDSDEIDEFGEAELSDSEYRTALSAPRPPSNLSRPIKRNSVGTEATSPDQASSKRSSRSSAKPISTEVYGSFSLGEKEFRSGRSSRSFEKPPPPVAGPSSRASVMRKAAMIQSGIASHSARSSSPSFIDPKNPPFPIPTRASSRKPSISISVTSDGRSSPSTTSYHRRSGSRTFYSNVRRVRSANALPPRHYRNRRGSDRSPPLSPSTEAPESPGLPPLPRNDITTPRTRDNSNTFRRHRHELSNNTVITANTEAVSQTSSQAPGVVDAIAQTMVGEWMFKYVRRRKSFGVPDNTKDETSNDRHKRWVWLAPYERAILWSSKQPSSGSALLGKTGRKLTIQSVLDVKDDNPPPKGVTTAVFNRSILILTPQRALKFTAPNAERHYLWLTALSFLAHSSQAIPEILAPTTTLSVKQQPLPDFELPRAKIKRGGIRDSIRIAKGRTVGPKSDIGASSIPSIPSVPSSRMGDVASFRVTEPSVAGSAHTREPSADAAEPPMIPRFHDRVNVPATAAHGRKRSNTGGHVPPPLSFRGFSGPVYAGTVNHHPAGSIANGSVGTAGSSDIYQSQGSASASWGLAQTPASTVSSQQGNFFDAIGTVRMEAFISPLAYPNQGEYPEEEVEYRHLARRRSKELRRRNSRSRRRDHYGRGRGSDDFFGGNKTAGEEDFYRGDDPFKGF